MVKKNHNPLKRSKQKTKKRSNSIKKKPKNVFNLTHDSAQLWDPELTKDQNYARLGISFKQNYDLVKDKDILIDKLLDTIPVDKLDDIPEPGLSGN